MLFSVRNYRNILIAVEFKIIIPEGILVRFRPVHIRRAIVPAKKKEFDFEKTLIELENLVEKIEQGDTSLEESLKLFERGVSLTRACQKALSDAEQKVQILMQDGDKQSLSSFTAEQE